MATKQGPIEVEATKGFQNGQIGNKEEGDKFDYDWAKDPHGLRALGVIRKVPPAKPEAGAQA